MNCKWDELLRILPPDLREIVDKEGKGSAQEIRMRIGCPIKIRYPKRFSHQIRIANENDIQYVINAATKYSPWAMQTSSKGYISVPGGHRIGISGILDDMSGATAPIQMPLSLCIRIAREVEGCADKLKNIRGNVLILGPPGSGKTTVLRDYIRLLSSDGLNVSVADERREIFPFYGEKPCFFPGENTDVMLGRKKGTTALTMLRTMAPDVVAMDELTDEADMEAALSCFHCGVNVVATVHAGSFEDYLHKPSYKKLNDVFHLYAVLNSTQHLHVERL